MLTPLMAACLAGGALPLAAQTMLQGAEGAPGLPAAPAPAVQVQAAPLLIPAAQMANDDVIVEMHQAFRKRDKNKLSQLLPASRGHVAGVCRQDIGGMGADGDRHRRHGLGLLCRGGSRQPARGGTGAGAHVGHQQFRRHCHVHSITIWSRWIIALRGA